MSSHLAKTGALRAAQFRPLSPPGNRRAKSQRSAVRDNERNGTGNVVSIVPQGDVGKGETPRGVGRARSLSLLGTGHLPPHRQRPVLVEAFSDGFCESSIKNIPSLLLDEGKEGEPSTIVHAHTHCCELLRITNRHSNCVSHACQGKKKKKERERENRH